MTTLLFWLLLNLFVTWVQVDAFSMVYIRGLKQLLPVRMLQRPSICPGATITPMDGKNDFLPNYEILARTELQALAKQNNIKANAKSSDIIIALRQLNVPMPASSPETLYDDDEDESFELEPPEEKYTVSGVEDSELNEISEILSMQGLKWGDISGMKAAHLDPNRPQRVSVKRGKKSKESLSAHGTSDKASTVPGLVGVTHLGTTISSRDVFVPTAMKKRPKHDYGSEEPCFCDDNDRMGGSSARRGGEWSGRVKDRYGERTRPYDDEREEFNAQHRTSNKYTNYNTYPTNTHSNENSLSTHITSAPYTTRAVAPPTPPRISLDSTTLKAMLEYLIGKVGYPALHTHTHLRCFVERPTMASSLKVLRQPDMAWARGKVEYLYITEKKKDALAQ